MYYKSRSCLDHLAIGMAALCAVHCLLLPVLMITLPILATSIFVHEDFHLWMLLFVLPTTGLSIFLGCRKHRDRWTAILSMVGLGIMIAVTVIESRRHATEASSAHVCAGCVRSASEPLSTCAWFNTAGGLLLAGAHARNFRLCRNVRCSH